MCYVGKPAIAKYVLQTPPQEKLLGQPLLFITTDITEY